MAERSSDKKLRPSKSVVSQPKKHLSSGRNSERPKRADVQPPIKPATAPTQQPANDLFAKEEQYKLMNAELEAKTANLVREAEQLMKEQSEILSKPLSTLVLIDIDDEDDSRIPKPHQTTVQPPGVKAMTKKRVTSTQQNMCNGKQGKGPHCRTPAPKVSHVDDLSALEKTADVFLAKTIHSMEEKMKDADCEENAVDDEEAVGSGVSGAQIRVFKAKLRIMQEDLDQLSCEYYKKDDENAKLCAKIKELEEDRARLQKTSNIQRMQIEKHKVLAEESGKRCDGLQLQVSALHKEIENLNRSQKQAAAVHNTAEVRLNRALEEVASLKTQLNKMKQMSKDKMSEDNQSKENLLAENKMLKNQKAELIMAFKKQLKLIDNLKRQQDAKLLLLAEDEFIKALDSGES